MKQLKMLLAVMALLCMNFFTYGQSSKPYTEQSVWDVTMIKIKPGMGMDYLKSLNAGLRKMYDEGIKQGIIQSYKIMMGDASAPTDWNLLILVEYKNMAALDGLSDKMDALEKKFVGNEDAQKKVMISRVDMREIMGSKLMREIKFN